MNKVYLACIDMDGTMRSDATPQKAFFSKERCLEYLDLKRNEKWGYSFEMKEIELDTENHKSQQRDSASMT